MSESNKQIGDKLHLVLIEDEYWIVPHDPPIGPFGRKPEADMMLSGAKQFYMHHAIPEDTDESE